MNINLGELKKFTDEQVLMSLMPIISDIYKNYDYLFSNEEEFYNLVLNEIKKTKKRYTGKTSYEDYLRKKIEKSINSDFNKNISSSKREKIIINNYIEQFFKDVKNYNDAVYALQQLDMFLESTNYASNPNILIEIAEKNNDFINAMQLVIDAYNSRITMEIIENLVADYKLIFMIKTYCEFNDIEITESLVEEDYVDVCTVSSFSIFKRDIKKYPLLSLMEEQDLAMKVAHGDELAREKFINSNLRLVVSIASKYIGVGLDYEDLIQEGIIGLTTAVDRYDFSSGYKFSTYATYWIRQSITRAIADRGRTIRIPVYLCERVIKYRKTVSTLSVELGRNPTKKEVADKMNLSESEISKLMTLTSDTISLNSYVGEDEEHELESLIPGDDTSIEEALMNIMRIDLYKFLETLNLNSREKAILVLRYGLDGREAMTLEEIGKACNLTRERVRQINAKVLHKIRRSPYVNSFALYMQNPTQSLHVIEEMQKQNVNTIKEIHHNTIYEHFSEYDKSSVDKVLKKLSSSDYDLIKLYYGDNLNKPSVSRLQGFQCYRFSYILLPKIKLLLDNMLTQENRCFPTIYDKFKDYTREEVDGMLEKLSKEETKLIKLYYGDDLDNPVESKLNSTQHNYLTHTLFPKMVKLLTKKITKLSTIYERFLEYSREEVDEMLKKLSYNDLKLIRLRYGSDLTKPVCVELPETQKLRFNSYLVPKMRKILLNNKQETSISLENGNIEDKHFDEVAFLQKNKECDKIEKEDYEKVVNLLINPIANSVMNELNSKEIIVVYLKFGYVDGKCFSNNAIMEFLKLEEKEVLEITKKALLLYKDQIEIHSKKLIKK